MEKKRDDLSVGHSDSAIPVRHLPGPAGHWECEIGVRERSQGWHESGEVSSLELWRGLGDGGKGEERERV